MQIERNEDGEYAGSAKTKTNGMQLLKGSNILIQGGEIAANDSKILIQNYSNLTLQDVVLRGTETDTYVLSNNFGVVHLKGSTQILAIGSVDGKPNVAFDLWYGMSASYDAGISVYIDDPTVVIQGPIEFGKANRASQEDFLANTHLYVCFGYDLSTLQIPEGYTWSQNNVVGMYELVPSGT